MEKREEEEERIDDGEETDEEKERGGWAHEAFEGVSLSLSLLFSLFGCLESCSRIMRLCFFFSFEKLCARASARLHISLLLVCVCVCVTYLCVCI